MAWPDGSTFSLTAGDDSIEASVRLPGEFNVENATAAITAAAALGLDIEAVASGVAACEGVPGRMERIGGAPFDVIVDYAHTPEAMRAVLATLATGGRGAADRRVRVRGGAIARSAVWPRAGRPQSWRTTQCSPRRIRGRSPRSRSSRRSPGRWSPAAAAKQVDFERVGDRQAAIARALEVARNRATWCCWRGRATSGRSNVLTVRMIGMSARWRVRRSLDGSGNDGAGAPSAVAGEPIGLQSPGTASDHVVECRRAGGLDEGGGDACGRAEAARRGTGAGGAEGRRGACEDGRRGAMRERHSRDPRHGAAAVARACSVTRGREPWRPSAPVSRT